MKKEEVTQYLKSELSDSEQKLLGFIARRQSDAKHGVIFSASDYAQYLGTDSVDFNELFTIIKNLKITAVEFEEEDGVTNHIPLLSFYIVHLSSKTIKCQINPFALEYIQQL